MIRMQDSFSLWHRGVDVSISRQARIGAIVIAAGIGAGGIWAVTAPIASAVVSSGVVIAAGQNKAIQHLEGGIIEQILVQEGDTVEEGQTIIRLSETSARATLQRISTQYDGARAVAARYIAERDGTDGIAFPADMVERRSKEPGLAEIMDGQDYEFRTRRSSLEAQVSVLESQIDAAEEQITGLEAQRQSAKRQLELIEQELKDTRTLYEKGLAERTRVLALERTAAQFLGNEGQYTAQIAETRQAIAETKNKILSARQIWLEKASSGLRDAQLQVADFAERLKSAQDVADRIEIRAPVKGRIVKLYFNSPGGVIRPGETVADLLPSDTLEVEARIRPDDISRVAIGREAELRFPAFRSRTTPTVDGEVAYISADRLTDPRNGVPYYVARVQFARAELPKEIEGRLVPGMGAEVFIQTGERTFLEYLMAPFSDLFAHAFKEE